MEQADSGFSYERFFQGNTLMVIVPHEDDEINVAGTVICGARAEGMRVLCVFVTNGDYKYLPDVRIREAVRALGVLGVPEDDIVFLGYPDGGAHGEYSVLVHGRAAPMTAHGRTETCGGAGIREFCQKEYGHHQTLTWEHLLDDLEAVILKYGPDGLIAIDCDTHPDHRMCSEAFDTVMGRILRRPGNTYRPVVLKAFAYNTAFEGREDFYQANLLSTEIHTEALQRPGCMDNPCLAWEDRVRLPVPENCRTQDLGKNKIFQALCCHMSQKAMRRAERMINGDQVFWQRRTDNLALQGKMTVSAGESKYLNDFRIIGFQDISDKNTGYGEYLWRMDEKESRPWCRCDFVVPQRIGSAVLYGNIEDGSRILRGRLTFSTGFVMEFGPLRKYGRGTPLSFPVQSGVTWVRFESLEREGVQAGLSEWELFSPADEAAPLLKICADGHFAYRWMTGPGHIPEISAYHPAEAQLRWFVNGEMMTLEEINERLRTVQASAHVRVEEEAHPEIWDESVFLPASQLLRWRKNCRLLRSRLVSWWENQREKRPHHRLKAFLQKE